MFQQIRFNERMPAKEPHPATFFRWAGSGYKKMPTGCITHPIQTIHIMKYHLLRRVLTGALFVMGVFLTNANAQTPFDGIMIEKNSLCAAMTFTQDNWDHYWEGTLKRDNGNIGVAQRQTVAPMFSWGLTDRLNILGSINWVRTNATGGQMAGVSGLQDWSLWVKLKAFEHQRWSVFVVAGGSGPASNYLPDYMPLNLGLGSYEGSLRLIAKHDFDKGFFTRAFAAWHVRSHTTIERNYYYTTQGFYSDKVDMPNALTYGATVGKWLLDDALRLQLNVDGLHTTGGHDIRRQDAGFPSNKMIFVRAGADVRYYLPPSQKLGIFVSAAQVLSGRNIGQSFLWTGGIMYQFGKNS